jgi:hypothetical protein
MHAEARPHKAFVVLGFLHASFDLSVNPNRFADLFAWTELAPE